MTDVLVYFEAPNPYRPAGRWLVEDRAEHSSGIVFASADRTAAIRAGAEAAIRLDATLWVEGPALGAEVVSLADLRATRRGRDPADVLDVPSPGEF